MMGMDSNLRKAAVLIRSLDGDTAAVMLGQLSAAEAASIRAAIRELGPLDPEEQADVAAEFHRTRPATATRSHGAVELELSTSAEAAGLNNDELHPAPLTSSASSKRFEFLASASVEALVRFLSREHSQTIAVVLAHLAPERAAGVLVALPSRLQADTVERLSVLGETDSESVTALEQELAAWMATRGEDRGTLAKRRETVANILAATDAKTRRGIVANLRSRNRHLAEQIEPSERAVPEHMRKPAGRRHFASKQAFDTNASIQRGLSPVKTAPRVEASQVTATLPATAPAPVATSNMLPVEFDQIGYFDTQSLAVLLRDVDANVLAIALAGSREELVDKICSQMPKRIARAFRRELRRLGPMRLSDIEGAQKIIAEAASRHIARRRPSLNIA
jgi:flagellar motor switch protein FliG